MTSERTLTRITEIINVLSPDEAKLTRKLIEANERSEFASPYTLLATMVLDLREEIKVNEAKNAGKNNMRNAALRVLKNGVEHRPATMYAYTDAEGVQWLCDGMRMLRFNEPLNLPALPRHISPLDYQRIWKHQESDFVMESELPTASDLRAFIKTFKAENKMKYMRGKRKKAEYHFGEGYPVVDAEFLLDCMNAVPDARVAKFNRLKSVYIIGEKSGALLMPIARPEIENGPRSC